MVDLLPRLSQIERERPYAVAVGGKFHGNRLGCARVKQDALRLFPADVGRFLAKVCVKLVEISSRKFRLAEGILLQGRGVEFGVHDDGPGLGAQTDVRFHAWNESFSLGIQSRHLPADHR